MADWTFGQAIKQAQLLRQGIQARLERQWRPLLAGMVVGTMMGVAAGTGYVILGTGEGPLWGDPGLNVPGDEHWVLEPEQGKEADEAEAPAGDDDAAARSGDDPAGDDAEASAEAFGPAGPSLATPVAGDLRLVEDDVWVQEGPQFYVHWPGILLAGAPGSSVLAPLDGTVAAVEPAEEGVWIVLEDGEGVMVRLMVDQVVAAAGHPVQAGHTIGRLGPAGTFYLEVRLAGEAVPPWSLLP